jgi:heterotetrameric sarcosine oxidase gamma subunit
MVEAGGPPPRQSALGDLLAPRRIGPEAARPGLSLSERPALAIWQISAWGAADVLPLRAALSEQLGLTLPEGPAAASEGGIVLFPVAPRRWWLVLAEDSGSDLAARLAAAATGRAALTDLSHGRTVLRLRGPASRNVLQKLCRIDLHPRALPAGRVAQTSLGQVAALVHALDDGSGFDLYLPRSLAYSAVESLFDAASGFGLETGVDPSAVASGTATRGSP